MKTEMKTVNNGQLITKVNGPVKSRKCFLTATADWRYNKPQMWMIVVSLCAKYGVKIPNDKAIIVVDLRTRTIYTIGLGIWAQAGSAMYPVEKEAILESCLSHHAAKGRPGDPWTGHDFRFIAELHEESIQAYDIKEHERYVPGGTRVKSKAIKHKYSTGAVSVNDTTVSDTTGSGNIYINVVGTATVNINK